MLLARGVVDFGVFLIARIINKRANNMKTYLLRGCFIVMAVLVTACGQDKFNNAAATEKNAKRDVTILVFSKTTGYRHESIETGIEAINTIARKKGYRVIATEDASYFVDEKLKNIDALVFLNTTGDVLDNLQQIAMERYIQAGGGFVGVHAAADTEWNGDWFWYRNLVGGVFKSHPDTPSNVQQANVSVVDANFAASEALPKTFALADEWYNFRDLYEFTNHVLTVDESSYQGGEHGDYHPIAWYHNYDGGRAFYTGLGHAKTTYQDANFLAHLEGGLAYAIGDGTPKNYSNVRPYDTQLERTVLLDHLNEPISFDFLPNGDVLLAERPGNLKIIDGKTHKATDLGFAKDIAFLSHEEMGLVGVAVDPNFATTGWVYTYYTAFTKNNDVIARIARFDVKNQAINFDKQTTIIEWPVEKNCCHMGGDLAFTPTGELFIATGDNTSPRDQDGFNPVDFREGLRMNDALRTSGNTNDLRGKILRIKPLPEGGYGIPKGNLFSNANEGRPEIYAMGTRNAFTLTYDAKTGDVFYGDVGPDASDDNPTRGPRGYDEINRLTGPAHMGWPWVIGDNYPYVKYDFVAKRSTGEVFDPQNLINYSPNNTGAKKVPAAQAPLIWYPYGNSEQFPEVGSGGRTALVADVYRADKFPAATRLPEYYDGKLFIVEFMRNWVKVVTFDENNGVRKIEPFAPQISYVLPIDARFGPDGALYVLEYGSAWFKENTDAQLSRITFNPNNQAAAVTAVQTETAAGHQFADVPHAGEALAKNNGCMACHKLDSASVGPAFKQVAAKYKDDPNAVAYLVDKIAKGGGGVWGPASMPPFAYLDEASRQTLAEYVLSR